MDAFSVSVANGLQNPGMSRKRMFCIAGTFAGFQFLMPMIGWFCVRAIAEQFAVFQRMIPWIAFVLLGLIGGKMVLEGLRGGELTEEEEIRLTGRTLLLQGIATSIDALSAGFTIAHYSAGRAFSASVLIAAATLLICLTGIRAGRALGMRIAGRASVLGGAILLLIGIRILLGG